MPPIPPLFTIPIEGSDKPAGKVVATQPAPKVYLLTFEAAPDNRLTPGFNAALLAALDVVDRRLPRGVVVTTSAIAKFYSNGLDFDSALATPHFFEGSFYPLLRRLLTYPMPTIALLPGHTFAGGLMLAMAHDYRVMNPDKGFLCLNEVDFGAPLRPPMAGLFRTKLAPTAYRSLALEGRRFAAKDALEERLVDVLGGWDEAAKLIADRKLADKGKAGVYGVIKEELYREEISYLDAGDQAENRDCEGRAAITGVLNDKAEKRVADWEAKGGVIAGTGSAKL